MYVNLGWKLVASVQSGSQALCMKHAVHERTSSILFTVLPVSMLTTVREEPQEQNM